MFSNIISSILNSSLTESLEIYWSNLTSLFFGTNTILRERPVGLLTYETFPLSVEFDEFQWKLVKTFVAFLLLNLFLIFVSWKIYGKRICVRFMKPPTSKAIEDLKSSVSKLKLPKEHSPRI